VKARLYSKTTPSKAAANARTRMRARGSAIFVGDGCRLGRAHQTGEWESSRRGCTREFLITTNSIIVLDPKGAVVVYGDVE
jgi:hypothetical protein